MAMVYRQKKMAEKNKYMASFLTSLSEVELAAWLKKNNEPAYRAGQIFDWIYSKFILSPNDMRNIPRTLREKLANDFCAPSGKILESVKSDDGVEKILLGLHDENTIESVIIPYENRKTFCLSTQIGCAVKCCFCASGLSGFVRNLETGEIVEQLIHCCKQINSRPDNIVFMGIGEPFMNYSNLIKSLKIINNEKLFGMSPRRITVSTSGYLPGIRRFADEKEQWNLAISLHAADETTRSKIIPEKLRFPLREIAEACIYWNNKTGRIITLEYVLIAGLNDSPAHAAALARFAKRIKAKINLIPYNKNEISPFERPSRSQIIQFENVLVKYNTLFTRRAEKGASIKAACGQLMASVLNRKT